MFWTRKKRLDQIRRQPFPADWTAVLERRVSYYAILSPDDQQELQGHINVFIAEKNFEGCGGLELTDEIKITIAAYACILLLHRDSTYYPRVDTVLVYPTAFVAEAMLDEYGPVEIHGEEVLSGEAWQQGVVILSWYDFETRSSSSGSNVILHEFAHQLDMENGEADGFPDIVERELLQVWPTVLQHEFDQLNKDIDCGRPTLIDPYGAESPAEFFAVATESFFEAPCELTRRHPDLYDVLRRFYRQDPAAVLGRLH